jgi:hypothetical protein
MTFWGTLQIRIQFQAQGEPGQAPVPTPTLETNKQTISLFRKLAKVRI